MWKRIYHLIAIFLQNKKWASIGIPLAFLTASLSCLLRVDHHRLMQLHKGNICINRATTWKWYSLFCAVLCAPFWLLVDCQQRVVKIMNLASSEERERLCLMCLRQHVGSSFFILFFNCNLLWCKLRENSLEINKENLTRRKSAIKASVQTSSRAAESCSQRRLTPKCLLVCDRRECIRRCCCARSSERSNFSFL